MKQQLGFTLIELIIIIVILGILAATATPKFINLKKEAEHSAAESVAGTISVVTAMNYEKVIIHGIDKTKDKQAGIAITNCNANAIKTLLQDPTILDSAKADSYSFATIQPMACSKGKIIDCKLTKTGTTFVPNVIAKVTCTGTSTK